MTAIDMSAFIAPKSDQLNSDDLIGGPRTIIISAVRATPDSAEQPIAVSFEGDDGKPYKPCKSMRRVMVAAWGPDASQYVGRSMTLYRDPKVQFGGMQVGGIRISHMSHIERDMTMALTATRAKRAPYTVKVLAAPARKPAEDGAAKWTSAFIAKVRACGSEGDLAALSDGQATRLAELKAKRPELHQQITDAIAEQTDSLKPGRTDADHGDQFDDTGAWAE